MFCPICKKQSQEKYKPFCSLRCSQLDLHAWFSESYAVASKNDAAEDAEEFLNDLENGDHDKEYEKD